MLKAGQAAPTFVLPDADMEPMDITGFRGKNHVILFFYPKDDTPEIGRASCWGRVYIWVVAG